MTAMPLTNNEREALMIAVDTLIADVENEFEIKVVVLNEQIAELAGRLTELERRANAATTQRGEADATATRY